MEQIRLRFTVEFNRGTAEHSQRYFLVTANNKVQAIKTLLDYMIDSHFLTVNLSSFKFHEVTQPTSVLELAE